MQLYDASPLIAATDSEIAAIYQEWLKVPNEPLVLKFSNPFTGLIQTFSKWDVNEADDIVSDTPISIGSLPHTELYGLTLEHIAALADILKAASYTDCLHAISRPERIGHNRYYKFGLHRIPSPVTVAIAMLSDASLKSTATSWSKCDAMETDGADAETCANLLADIRNTCRLATAESRSLFYLGRI